MIPRDYITELVQRSDIVDVVQSYVQLRHRGRTHTGLCPFHNEKTPSFVVYPETQSFYCFGCGAGGDVITFIKKINNVDYIEAVKFLAGRAGMALPEEDDQTGRLRSRIISINKDAARFYFSRLNSDAGRVGRAYWRGRGLSDATIKRFGLGYAPDSFGALRDHMRGKGYKDEELTAAWLAARGKKSGGIYDIFRARAMVHIIDIRGNVIAFGGRVLDDSKPKYLNTADTLAFKKTNNLFALNFAKSSGGKQLILCEGYMDVIALHQAGFTNAVAALGTSFTAEHARLIARYAEEVILVFDADSAGQKGTQRAIGLLRQTGVDIRVISIPDGKDPDEFIKHHGPERFRLLLERSANDVEYRLIALGKRHMLGTADGKVAYLREAAALLAALQSPIERDVYAGKLSAELGVNKSAILDQVQELMERRKKQQKSRQLSQIVRNTENTIKKANPDAAAHPRAVSAEEGLLGLLLLNPDYIGRIAGGLPPEMFATDFNRGLYQRLIQRYESGQPVDLAFLSADYDGDGMGYISRMIRDARERVNSLEEAGRYAGVIEEEFRLQSLNDPRGMSDEKISEVLEALRKAKGGQSS